MLSVFAILFPIVAGIIAGLVRMEDRNRCFFCAAVMLVTDILAVCAAAKAGAVTLLDLGGGVLIRFAPDNLGRLFLAVVLILYTAVCFYAFEYMKMEEKPALFFAFYFVSLGAMISVCLAGNLVTMYLCFEMATLTSVPLVLHEMTKEAVAAGLKYLFYSIAGALMGLLGVFFTYFYAGESAEFVYGGFVDRAALAGHEGVFLVVIFVAILGFGTKAGMYPMHGWLPTAHPIAPAPASALLSGIIAKAGVLAIIRLIYYSVGADILAGTWVQTAWMCLCMLTIFMGSMMAFREKVMKKRLAYSTISQISYILLGLSLLTEEGVRGGLIHVMSHAASKGCLFLVAGIFIYKLGRRRVDELRGVGRQMPLTMWCFMIVSLSLVGIPPMGGFLSKWVIATAAIGGGKGFLSVLAPIILLISALLTAGYLFPVAVDAFFPGREFEESEEGKAQVKDEPSPLMTVPLVVLCAAALAAGLFGTRIAGLVL